MDCSDRAEIDASLSETSNAGSAKPPLPRPVLRHLVREQGIWVGSRVIDVGCRTGDLVRFLTELGIDASGLDDSAEDVAAARRVSPRLDFRVGIDPWNSSKRLGGPFDVILVRDLAVYHDNVFSPSAFASTGYLLFSLRPGGRLVFLKVPETDSNQRPDGHDISCFARHVSFFPGTCRVSHVRSGFDLRSTWSQLIRRQPLDNYQTVSLRIPEEPLSRADWAQLAANAGEPDAELCCDWASRLIKSRSRTHRAA